MSRPHDLFGPIPWNPKKLGRRKAGVPVRSRAKPLLSYSLASWIRHIGRLLAVKTCSSNHFDRFDATARQLTAEMIRACRHVEDLKRVEKLLLDARTRQTAGYHDLDRVWSRAELGTLIVETRNRLHLLRIGRDAKAKGPRWDPRRLPDQALERLIQTHPSIEVVEELRAERRRRHG